MEATMGWLALALGREGLAGLAGQVEAASKKEKSKLLLLVQKNCLPHMLPGPRHKRAEQQAETDKCSPITERQGKRWRTE